MLVQKTPAQTGEPDGDSALVAGRDECRCMADDHARPNPTVGGRTQLERDPASRARRRRRARHEQRHTARIRVEANRIRRCPSGSHERAGENPGDQERESGSVSESSTHAISDLVHGFGFRPKTLTLQVPGWRQP